MAKSRSVPAKRPQTPAAPPDKPKPELTPAEIAEFMRWEEIRRERELKPTPRVSVVADDDKKHVSINLKGDKDAVWQAKLKTALGGVEGAVAVNVLNFLVNALPPGHDGKPDQGTLNAALSFVCSMRPRDEAEVMLLAQMAVTAQTVGVINGQMVRTSVRAQQQEQGNLVTKMMRTYTAQMESLKRYRGKGEQRVVVEHVHVYEGGQAIVGQVNTGTPGTPGSSAKSLRQSHAGALEHLAGPNVWGKDEERDALSVALSEGTEALPDARGHQSGSAEGK